MYTQSEKRFLTFSLFTILSVYLLIAAGGIVRTTGSGMGCPDWPKCFGQWVPPTDVSQLPPNYQEVFAAPGKPVAEFNVFHTYTEYINRLLGALVGLFILITVFFSYSYIKTNAKVFWISLLVLAIVLFQGWLGSRVVASNLAGYLITLHMLLALVIVAMLIYVHEISRKNFEYPVISASGKAKTLKVLIVVVLITNFIQIALGTQVREAVDEVRKAGILPRVEWINELGNSFTYHRELSILVFIQHVILYVLSRKTFQRESRIMVLINLTMWLMILQIVSGIVLSNYAIPPAFQAIHLIIASLMFGMQYWSMIYINRTKLES